MGRRCDQLTYMFTDLINRITMRVITEYICSRLVCCVNVPALYYTSPSFSTPPCTVVHPSFFTVLHFYILCSTPAVCFTPYTPALYYTSPPSPHRSTILHCAIPLKYAIPLTPLHLLRPLYYTPTLCYTPCIIQCFCIVVHTCTVLYPLYSTTPPLCYTPTQYYVFPLG